MPEPELDPLLHQPTRLRLMLVLYRNRQASAAWLKRTLGLTDGNLFGHARRLVEADYLLQGRVLSADGFAVVLRITPTGTTAIKKYLQAWRTILESEDKTGSDASESL